MSEVHPHGRPRRRPAATPLNWAGPRPFLRRKCHPVLPGIFDPAFSIALLHRSPIRHAVLGLAVRSQ